MHVVIPISSHDINLAPKFVEVLKKFGTSFHHSALVIVPKDFYMKSSASIDPIVDGIKAVYGKVDLFLTEARIEPNTPERRGAQTATSVQENAMWKQALIRLQQLDWHEPFVWLELDCCPVAKDWLDILERAWKEAKAINNKLILGHVRQAVRTDAEGKTHEDTGDYVVEKVAVYPPAYEYATKFLTYKCCTTESPEIHNRWEYVKFTERTNLLVTVRENLIINDKAIPSWLTKSGKAFIGTGKDRLFGDPVLVHVPHSDKPIADLVLKALAEDAEKVNNKGSELKEDTKDKS